MQGGGVAHGPSTIHPRRGLYVLLAIVAIVVIAALAVLAGNLMTSTSAPADVAPIGWGGVTPIHDDAWNVR